MIIAVASENEKKRYSSISGIRPNSRFLKSKAAASKASRPFPPKAKATALWRSSCWDHGVDLLICGGIGAGAQKALADEGIKLVAGVSGKVEGAMSGYLNGTLEFRTDFTCNHHHGDHAHGEGHTCGGHGTWRRPLLRRRLQERLKKGGMENQ